MFLTDGVPELRSDPAAVNPTCIFAILFVRYLTHGIAYRAYLIISSQGRLLREVCESSSSERSLKKHCSRFHPYPSTRHRGTMKIVCSHRASSPLRCGGSQEARPFKATRRVWEKKNPLDFFHVCPLVLHEKMGGGAGRPVHKLVFACPGRAGALVRARIERGWLRTCFFFCVYECVSYGGLFVLFLFLSTLCVGVCGCLIYVYDMCL